MTTQPSCAELPASSEPATLPARGRSGAPLKFRLIRSLAETLDAVKACARVLDEAIETARAARRSGSLRPPGGLQA